MKPLIIFLSFILLFVLPNPFAAAQTVFDKDGDPLQPGVEYYARRFSSMLTGPTLNNTGCPLGVILEQNILPIIIHPKVGTDIVESSGLYVEFADANTSPCPSESTIWRVVWDSSLNRSALAGGGQYGDLQSELQIEKSGQFAYTFVFNPDQTVGRFVTIKLVSGLGGWRLVLNDTATESPIQVLFFKKSYEIPVLPK